MKRRVALFSLVFIVVLSLLCVLMVEVKTPPFIRLHILANSDGHEDQALKYKVRDEIITAMREEFKDSQSLEESRGILLERLGSLEKRAGEYVGKEGYTYPVKAVYGDFNFPRKNYGTFTLPAGRYEALRIIIGEGKGANWWCILFPPLCVVEGGEQIGIEEELAEDLTQEQLHCKAVEIKPAFKLLELYRKATSSK